jgi:hypothetical protein
MPTRSAGLAVFTWMLRRLADAGLVKGNTKMKDGAAGAGSTLNADCKYRDKQIE